MDNFEIIGNQFIKKLDDGRKVFFPQGMFGRVAYIIESDKIEADIRHRIKVFNIFFITIIALCAGFFGEMLYGMTFGGFLFFLLALCIVGWAFAKLAFLNYTLKMEKIKIANSLTDWWNDLGEKGHPLFITGGIIFSSLFVFTGTCFYLKEYDPKMLFTAVFFTLILIPYLVAGIRKLKKR